jgi:hypothetical protein
LDLVLLPDGRKFLQFGKNPIKYIAWLPKDKNFKFMIGAQWDDFKRWGGLIIGKTKRPLDIRRLYENRT